MKSTIPKLVLKRGRKKLNHSPHSAEEITLPSDAVLSKKKYYKTTEVAQWFNISAALLRHWEKEFDCLSPKKNLKGDRLFSVEEIKKIEQIHRLIRTEKFTIEGANHFLKTRKQPNDIFHLTKQLTALQSFLLQLKAHL